MKSFVLATAAAFVLADDPAPTPAQNGTPCTDNDGCGDKTGATVCCVIASGGKFCKDDACTTTEAGTAANVAFCETTDKDKMDKSKIISQENFDKTKTVKVIYTSDNFTCMKNAKALAAACAVVLSVASMI